jgi:hypothetical protein
MDSFSFRAVSDMPLHYTDVVKVQVMSARTAGTFAGNWQTGDTTTTGKSVTIGKPIFTAGYIDPTEERPTVERYLAIGRECAYGTAKKVLQDTLAQFVAANIGDTAADKLTVTAANYDTDDQADARKLLWDKGVEGPMAAIHTTAYATALGKDASVKDLSASGSMFLQTGELPPTIGFRNFYTDAFPTTVTTENTEVILTGTQTAAVALGAPGDPSGEEAAAGIRQMVVVDPDTGIPLAYRMWVDSSTGFHWIAVSVMKGQAFIQDAAVRIVSA